MAERFQTLSKFRELIAFILGVLIAVTAGYIYVHFFLNPFSPLAIQRATKEVHVHSDFLVIINEQRVDFTEDKYQSKTGHILLENFHLHDNNDEVIHRHADGLTLGMFLGSLGYTLTNSCLTTDTDETFCTDDIKSFLLYVNGEIVTDVTSYIPQEEDQILVYYGDPKSDVITNYLNEITTDACIYSGTCPERGTPPPESCGLTCEI